MLVPDPECQRWSFDHLFVAQLSLTTYQTLPDALCTASWRLCTLFAWISIALTCFETEIVRQVSGLLRLHGSWQGKLDVHLVSLRLAIL